MAKIQNISGIHSTLGFPEFDILENYRKSFHESELGRLRVFQNLIFWKTIARVFMRVSLAGFIRCFRLIVW